MTAFDAAPLPYRGRSAGAVFDETHPWITLFGPGLRWRNWISGKARLRRPIYSGVSD